MFTKYLNAYDPQKKGKRACIKGNKNFAHKRLWCRIHGRIVMSNLRSASNACGVPGCAVPDDAVPGDGAPMPCCAKF